MEKIGAGTEGKTASSQESLEAASWTRQARSPPHSSEGLSPTLTTFRFQTPDPQDWESMVCGMAVLVFLFVCFRGFWFFRFFTIVDLGCLFFCLISDAEN